MATFNILIHVAKYFQNKGSLSYSHPEIRNDLENF